MLRDIKCMDDFYWKLEVQRSKSQKMNSYPLFLKIKRQIKYQRQIQI
jgi:hypothetical protein